MTTNKKEVVFIESNRRGAGAHAMRLARKWDYQIRFLTRYPDYYGEGLDSPTQIADLVCVTDTFDTTRILYSIDHEKTCAILAFNDYHVVPAALAAQALDLPHASVAGLINARFKDRTRQSLSNCPGNLLFKVIDLEHQELESLSWHKFPCIVKPVDDSGSHDVYVCEDLSSLIKAISIIKKRTINARGYVLTRKCLIEEYVEGSEFSAELFWDTIQQDWYLLGFTSKTVTQPPVTFELGHIFPHTFNPELASYLESCIRQWLNQIKLRGLAAHVEFRLNKDNEPVCIEINPRLGGDKIDTLLNLSLAVDPVAWYLKLHLGEQIDLPSSPLESRRVAGIRFILPKYQKCVTKLTLNTENTVDIQELDITKTLPKNVIGDGRMTDRLGYIITTGNDAQETSDKLNQAIEKVYIHYA